MVNQKDAEAVDFNLILSQIDRQELGTKIRVCVRVLRKTERELDGDRIRELLFTKSAKQM